MTNKLLHPDTRTLTPTVFQAMAWLVVSALACPPGAHAGGEPDNAIGASSLVFTQAKQNTVASL